MPGQAGTSGIASSFYIAGVRGSAVSALDNLQYGGHFSAQFNNLTTVYTKDTIAVFGQADAVNGSGTFLVWLE